MHSSTVAKSILNHPSAATNRAAAQSVIGRAPRLRWFALRQEIPHRVYCLLAAAGFIAVFALWAWLSHQPFVKRVFLPTPETVWETDRAFLPDENLWTDVKVSVMRVTAGFLLAAALALPLGIWMGSFKAIEGLLQPLAKSPAHLDANVGLETKTLRVANTGDRPIEVGSHFHFFEVNTALDFGRAAARGFRLNIPAGTAIRFEPGDTKEVELVALAGKREVYGLNNKVDGPLDKKAEARGCDAETL